MFYIMSYIRPIAISFVDIFFFFLHNDNEVTSQFIAHKEGTTVFAFYEDR